MEKKIVSVRLEESEHEYFKKRARQQGMTFTEFVSNSLHYYDILVGRKEINDNAWEVEKKSSFAGGKSDVDGCLPYPSIEDKKVTSSCTNEVAQAQQKLRTLAEELLNEKNRHEDLGKQIAELGRTLNRISREEVTSEQEVDLTNSQNI